MTYHTLINGTAVTIPEEMVARLNRPIPRYTSYPTVPEWTAAFSAADAAAALEASNVAGQPLSLYIHLPFCAELCHFCGCNTIITQKEGMAARYLGLLDRELALIAAKLDRRRAVVQVHLGGGTPTYLSPPELSRLSRMLNRHFLFSRDAEMSVEVDPRVTASDHLHVLSEIGFNRISMGVQDHDPKVQEAVNRVQPLAQTAAIVETARRLKFQSINIDLMYGLPFQTESGFAETVSDIVSLAPDRIALFNFAYLPSLKPHMKKIDPETLPNADAKFRIFCRTIEQLYHADYTFIGLDHFAKSNDELVGALRARTMWRNFQGYTTRRGVDLIALGITGISDLGDVYFQNTRRLSDYARALEEDRLPVGRGYRLNRDDAVRRRVIQELFCHLRADLADWRDYFADERKILHTYETAGLATLTPDAVAVTPLGQLFVRNIAAVFDIYLNGGKEKQPLFSHAI